MSWLQTSYEFPHAHAHVVDHHAAAIGCAIIDGVTATLAIKYEPSDWATLTTSRARIEGILGIRSGRQNDFERFDEDIFDG